MIEEVRRQELPVDVREKPHWRVLIRPTRFDPQRIATLPECWRIVESTSVTLRGWDYPHVDRECQGHGDDWIESWCDFERHLEYWRLYQSAQFVHFFAFWEDGEDRHPRRSALIGMPDGFVSTGYLDIIGVLYTLTEVFEFSARMAARGVLGDAAEISVRLVHTKDRLLLTLDPRRVWHSFCPATQDELGSSWAASAEQLSSEAPALALKAAIWFYERFGWSEPSVAQLMEDQRKFLNREL